MERKSKMKQTKNVAKPVAYGLIFNIPHVNSSSTLVDEKALQPFGMSSVKSTFDAIANPVVEK